MSEISFTKVDLPYGWLGNMSPHVVKYQNKWYRTTEALFQTMRYEGFPEVQEEIRDAKSPMTAKMKAKKHKALIDGRETPVEREAKDLERMRTCLLLKLAEHPVLKRHLLATKDATIIEDCSSRPRGSGLFWGMARIESRREDGSIAVEWKGRNELGKLWMALREELKNAAAKEASGS
jgi:ribA/ribD-fused uncharacterized protein